MKPFIETLKPAPVKGGFSMEDYWVWCGSAIKGPDGLFHLFAARWPKKFPFFSGYKVSSEVVRAVSSTPEGPYEFQEVLLPDRGEGFWDGRMTHNPTIVKYKEKYLLFYIGGTFSGKRPAAHELLPDSKIPEEERASFSHKPDECYQSIKIGCAMADSPAGPWIRPDSPCLDIRRDKWDSTVVTNPGPLVMENGEIYLYYRSNTPKGLRIGLAKSAGPGKPYERVSDNPVLDFPSGDFVEDIFVWQNEEGSYEMLAKDMLGGLTGEKHAGVHCLSENGVDWSTAPDPKAYTRHVKFDDGTLRALGHMERPQLLFANDEHPHRPTHLFTAASEGGEGNWTVKRTWNMAIPLT
jgi:hypothetical protein